MPVEVARGTRDPIVDQIAEALAAYERKHPQSRITIYRQNPYSVRVRIIDPDFQGMSKADRNDYVWRFFDPLSDESQADVSMLVLLTPSEVKKSFANMEFEDPVPSEL